MALGIDDLVTPVTEAQVLASILSVAASLGLSTTSWQSGQGEKHRTGRCDPDLFDPRGKLPGSVWRIAPPLTVTRADIDLAMTIFDQALHEAKAELARQPAA